MPTLRQLRWALVARPRVVRHIESRGLYQRLTSVRWVGPPPTAETLDEPIDVYASVAESVDRRTGAYLAPGTLYATTRRRMTENFESAALPEPFE